MNSTATAIQRLRDAIEECRRHRHHMRHALSSLEPRLPLDGEAIFDRIEQRPGAETEWGAGPSGPSVWRGRGMRKGGTMPGLRGPAPLHACAGMAYIEKWLAIRDDGCRAFTP
ncbi:hypothetical protein [Thioalkalivibrio sp. ALE20]|uniref:hypothetical protein n=1 Tax=Thioalkalivibrio sp. ALE20 TaxID=545275 RepID=UPI00036B0C4B|nr:hypothetical protein [Thioalkalivibrio sp. ALE20]